MDTAEIDRINHYLSGRLPEAACLEFQGRMILEGAFRAEVELSRHMRQGLADLRRTGELGRLLRRTPAFWQTPAYGIAASCLAVASALVALTSHQHLKALQGDRGLDQVHSAIALSAARAREIVRLAQTRGAAGKAAVIWTIDPAVGRLDMRVDVGPEAFASYALRLERIEPARPATMFSAPSVVAADGEVTVVLNAALFEPGNYRLTLRDAVGQEFNYGLHVVAAR
jgi:hypothetical protein